VKGNSKAKESAGAFKPMKTDLPAGKSLFKFVPPAMPAKNMFNFNFPKVEGEQKKEETKEIVQFDFGGKKGTKFGLN
jgi:hypothetical protein